MLARPLAGWKLALVAAMGGLVALIVAVPALRTGMFLPPQRLCQCSSRQYLEPPGRYLVEVSYRPSRCRRGPAGAAPTDLLFPSTLHTQMTAHGEDAPDGPSRSRSALPHQTPFPPARPAGREAASCAAHRLPWTTPSAIAATIPMAITKMVSVAMDT